MLSKDSIKTRLDELIKGGKELLEIMPPVDRVEPMRQDTDLIIKYRTWVLSCLNLIRNSFGPKHYFFDHFKKAITKGWVVTQPVGKTEKHTVKQPIFYCSENVAKAYAVLLYIKKEIELGLVSDVRHLYESNLFSNLLEQAFELLKKGYKPASAIYGRLVIENAIRGLCDLNNIQQKDKVSEMLVELRKLGIIDLPQERVIQAKYGIGSMAAHGDQEFSRYSDEDIKEMLEFIRDKILIIGT